MELQKALEMEMEVMTMEDAKLVEDINSVLGACGIMNGSGSCGGSNLPN